MEAVSTVKETVNTVEEEEEDIADTEMEDTLTVKSTKMTSRSRSTPFSSVDSLQVSPTMKSKRSSKIMSDRARSTSRK